MALIEKVQADYDFELQTEAWLEDGNNSIKQFEALAPSNSTCLDAIGAWHDFTTAWNIMMSDVYGGKFQDVKLAWEVVVGKNVELIRSKYAPSNARSYYSRVSLMASRCTDLAAEYMLRFADE